MAVASLAVVGCASDEAPEQPFEDTPGDSIVQDGVVDDIDAVDTEIEQSENLGFDEPDEG